MAVKKGPRGPKKQGWKRAPWARREEAAREAREAPAPSEGARPRRPARRADEPPASEPRQGDRPAPQRAKRGPMPPRHRPARSERTDTPAAEAPRATGPRADGREAGAHWSRGRRDFTPPPPDRQLRNVKLLLEYDGARFSGWQVQPNARTVAGSVQSALADLLGEEVRLVGAGRTDEGVHAEGQVANFLTRSRLPARQILPALNDRLPSDIRALRVDDVGPEFHARHSAVSRVYRYHVARRPSVFLRGHAWFAPGKVHFPLLQRTTERIVGFHDFASFTDLKLAQGASTKVDVTFAAWKESKELFVFRIAGSHFLPRMVRRLVGGLVAVATGDVPPATFDSWLERPSRDPARFTAPAMGLYLEHVEYGSHVAPAAQRALEAFEAAEGGAGEG